MTKDEFITMAEREIDRNKMNNKRSISFLSISLNDTDWWQVKQWIKDNGYTLEDYTCPTCRKNMRDMMILW